MYIYKCICIHIYIYIGIHSMRVYYLSEKHPKTWGRSTFGSTSKHDAVRQPSEKHAKTWRRSTIGKAAQNLAPFGNQGSTPKHAADRRSEKHPKTWRRSTVREVPQNMTPFGNRQRNTPKHDPVRQSEEHQNTWRLSGTTWVIKILNFYPDTSPKKSWPKCWNHGQSVSLIKSALNDFIMGLKCAQFRV